MKKKIVLVNAPYSLTERKMADVNYPTGILCVGTALQKAGYEVQLIECVLEDNYNDKILSLAEGALFIAFSVMTNQIACSLETSKLIKSKFPELPIIWGGIHPTLDPDVTIKSKYCDYVLAGEADETIVQLASCIEEKKDVSTIKGIYFKQDRTIKFNNQFPRINDISDFVDIDFDLVDVNSYLDLELDKDYGFFPKEKGSVRRLTLHTARGCPFKCSFCINSIVRGDNMGAFRYRSMSPEKIMESIKRYKAKYDINFISFGDDLFFANKKKVQYLVDKLIKENMGIKWYANVRADFFNEDYLNLEFLKKVEEAGCIRFALGIESGSEKVLKYLKKQLGIESILRAAAYIDKFNFVAGYSFMTGLPGEEEEDVFRTLCLIYAIMSIHKRAYIIGPQIYRPYPGSQLFVDCVKLGWKKPESLDDYVDGLEMRGHYSLDDMAWIKSRWHVFEAERFGERFHNGTAEWFLKKHCPEIFDEYMQIAEKVVSEIGGTLVDPVSQP